ncbi:MFS transporter [Nakamurella lactea]|uniref:MFS transporter n=1 Tax=Nakamurella lactea TaxID=459515 RepID=UPI0003F93E65|nr:MFS transporter [Nakamurella lactea]
MPAVEPLLPIATSRAHRRRWWILGTLCLSMLVVGLDATVLNVALTPIAESLRASTGQLQWIVNGFVLAFAVCLIPAGVLGDRIGRRRVLTAGLTVFVLASAAAAFTRTPAQLITARAVMGLGAAAVMPLALSIIPTVFGAAERRRAVAMTTVAMGLGMPLGPLIGGALLNHFWWGSTLLINVPLVAVALVAGLIVIPDSRETARRPLDPAGLVLSAVGFTALVYGIVRAPTAGWGSAVTLICLGVAVLTLAAFVAVERRAMAPIASRELLRTPLFVWPTVAIALASFVLLGLIFVVPQYLQAVRGLDALATGVRLMPLMVALVIGSGLAARAERRLSIRVLICLGLVVTAAGCVLLLWVGVDTGYPLLFCGLFVVGFGFGLSMPPAMDAMLGSLPADSESTATALNNAVKQLAGALGVALLGSLLSSAYLAGVTGAAASVPPAAAAAVRGSVQGAAAVADQLGGTAGVDLRQAAGTAFVTGMHHVTLACALVALATAALLAVALPAGPPAANLQ